MSTAARHVLVVMGTRPEAIKLAPVIAGLGGSPHVRATVCVTAQHRDLLDRALADFGIRADLDLDLMTPDQRPGEVMARVIGRVGEVLDTTRPDVVVVQGDTTSAVAAALASRYRGVAVAHVEAGVRTGNLDDPWPEEMNRRLIAQLATLHFAPTEHAALNLRAEGIEPASIVVTGNTSVDALLGAARAPRAQTGRVLVTCHRRINFRDDFSSIVEVIRHCAGRLDDRQFDVVLHPNPRVRGPLQRGLSDLSNVQLIPPMSYWEMLDTIESAWVVMTDSGGVQEEAPYLGTPVLVLRDATDRPEAVTAGNAVVVGRDPNRVVAELVALTDETVYRRRSAVVAPFGDGRAAARIVQTLAYGSRTQT